MNLESFFLRAREHLRQNYDKLGFEERRGFLIINVMHFSCHVSFPHLLPHARGPLLFTLAAM